MQRALILFACVSLASCESAELPGGIGGEGGATFDPCGANPTPGFDPVAAGLAACCSDGDAHCVPAEAVPGVIADNLASCATTSGGAGRCMPDNAIKQGANYVPQQCVSSVGQAKGVCLSRCVPRVANDPQAALLGQDGCRDDELCVPCINPLSGVATGACILLEPHCGDAGAGGQDAAPAICPYEGPPLIDPKSLPECAPACGGAHCVPATLVPAAQKSLLNACNAAGGVAGLCAPDKLIATGGNYLPKPCRSVAGAEGRCVSSCLPSVAAQAAQLPIDTCEPGEKCAPCFNPVAGDPNAPTGACTIACDHAKEPPLQITCPWNGPPLTNPATFPACSPACGGSHCVPAANVPTAQQSLLAPCPGGFCTPDRFIETGGKLIPKSCKSIAGVEGRCLSTCLPPVAADAKVLPKDVCGSDERCAPCFNPLAKDPMLATGACTLGCDKPKDPPQILMCPWTGPPIIDPTLYPACACAKSRCVPASNVPTDQQPLLEACAGGFCTPEDFIKTGGKLIPKSCTSVAGAEGRCLSTCLPPVAAQASLLPQSVCATGEKCAPCYNPTAANPSAPTGACNVGCDKPSKPPVILACPWTGAAVVDPKVFPQCPSCGGARCVPKAQVPASLTSQLDSCSGGYCVPDKMVAGAGFTVPQKCVPFAGAPAEGRCLSTCLPSVADKADSLVRDLCASGELCVPCYDPFTGVATGACTTACDKPTKPAFLFPHCCYDATCVPQGQVPSGQASKLNQDVCPSSFLCVPNEYLPGNFPYSCSAGLLGLQQGACVSRCINLGIGGIFGQKDCPGNHACVPCSLAPAGTPGC